MEHRPVDFNQDTIETALRGTPLGGLRVFQSVGSTNDEAISWAAAGAPDMSLVVADEQTAGRGRSGRKWSTPPGSALALSLILRGLAGTDSPGRLSGYGAVSAADAFDALGANASIKWPNDVLVQGRKVCGVLVESTWTGGEIEGAVVGIGINVLAESVPESGSIRFPATCLEECLGRPVDRIDVLRLVLTTLFEWRGKLESGALIDSWTNRLAFRGREVVITGEGIEPMRGTVDGLESGGSLRLLTPEGIRLVPMGEVQLATDGTMH